MRTGWFSRRFEVDTRSLAVFRVFIALVVLFDVVLRVRNFTYLYTDQGVVPLEVAREYSPEYSFSVFYLVSNSPTVVAVVFGATAVFSAFLAVGYKTRISTFLVFLCVVSIDVLNPFVLSAADALLRLLLFWSLFLPLGERWSVDAVYVEEPPRDTVTSFGSVIVLLQMVFVYLANGYHKIRGSEWWDGEAALIMMGRDEMTFLLGDLLSEFPALVRLGGATWFYLLLLSWLLVVTTGRIRYSFASLFVAGHLTLALSFRIGSLSFVAIAGVLLFYQTEFWEDLGKVRKRWGYSDRENLEAVGVKIANSVPYPRVLVGHQKRVKPLIHSLAVFALLMAVIVVAVNVVVVQILLTPAVLLTDAEVDREQAVEDTLTESVWLQPIRAVATNAGVVHQDWRMFATAVEYDKYYVYPAETEGGELLDVRNDRSLSFERPYQELQRQYGTYRERFYMNTLNALNIREDDDRLHQAHADRICREYAEERGTDILRLNMYIVYEQVTIQTLDTPESRNTAAMEFYRHGCGGNEPREITDPGMREITFE